MPRSSVRLALAAVALLAAAPAFAEGDAPVKSGPVFDFGLSAGLSSMSLNNIHFGLGQLGANLNTDIARTEGYAAPRANMMWPTRSGTFYGGVRAVGSFTRGDGDSWGLTVGRHWQWKAAPATSTVQGENMSFFDLDSAYLGWKSGDVLPFLGKDGLDLSVGPQNYQLGDGMVLVDGDDEAGQHKGIYWLDPRQAWENTGIARISAGPVRSELFALKTDSDTMDDTILGGSFDLVSAKLGRAGVSYFVVTDSHLARRKGLKVGGVHGRGHPLAFLPTLELAGEYDLQQNSGPGVNARAWFLEGSYFIPFLPWYPTLGYRYSSFSGDKAGTSANEGWDYLHNGSTPRGFGYWYQGIVVGTYDTRLSNLNTHFVNLTVVPPVQGGWMKVLYYNYRFDQTSAARVVDQGPIASSRFASEWDFVLGYSPTKKVDYMAIYGTARPGKGAKEYFSNISGVTKVADKTSSMLQFTMMVHF